jgi:DNA-binding winged helix-turn-helix (wHTH) protein
MQPVPDEKRYVRFGAYEADLRTGELRKHGIRLRLQEQPFQVLTMLLTNPGDLVTREQLQKRLWAGDTFVDFDHGLNTAINKLREVLSDSSASPKYIETLPRRG